MAYDNIPKVTGQSSLTYGGEVYWPITKWKVGTGVPQTTWLTGAVRFLMGEGSADGAYHILAQYTAYTTTGTNSGTNSGYRFIRKLGNAVTGTGNEATIVGANSFYSTLNENYSPYKMVNETSVSGNFIEYNTPYFARNCGTVGYGTSVTPANFRVATALMSSGTPVQTAVTDTWTAPSTATVDFSTTPSSGSGSINAIASQTLVPIMTWGGESMVVTYSLTLPFATVSDNSYVFDGWTVNDTNYNAGDTVTLSGSATVYPRLHLNTISFSVSVNGATTSYSNQTIGDPISSAPSIPSGYTLAGWSLTQSNAWSTTAPTITGSQPTVQAGWAGKTLYAVFSFVFNYKDTSSSATSTDTKYAQLKLDSYLRAQPYRSGYVFDGWEKTGGSTYQGGALYPISALQNTQTFTGQWSAASWVPVLMFKKTTAS